MMRTRTGIIVPALLFACAAFGQQGSYTSNLFNVAPKAVGGFATVGSMRFVGVDNLHYFAFNAPPLITTNQQITLPQNNVAGCVTNDGAGTWNYGLCGDASPVSVQSPMVLYSHFRDDNQDDMYFGYSRDLLNFVDVNPAGTFMNTTENRDPSIIYENGLFYIVSSPSATTGASKIQIWTSPDLIKFSGPTLLDMYPSYGAANGCCSFAPEWFIDPNSGSTYIVATNSNDGIVTFTPWFLKMDMTHLSVITATQVSLTGTSQNLIFDNYTFWDAGTATYYMMYVDEQTGTIGSPGYEQRIVWATSANLLGPYVQVPAPGVDTFGFSTTSEAASVLQQPVGAGVVVGNPGFETGTLPPWAVASGAASTTSAFHHSGSWAGALTSTTAINILAQSITGLTPGRQYQYSGWIRGSAAGIASSAVLEVSDGATTGSIVSASAVPTTSWQKLTLTFAAPASGNALISIQSTALTGPGGVFVDDFSLLPLDCLTVYADTWLFTFFRGNSFNSGNGRKYLTQYRDSCRTDPATPRFATVQGTQVDPIIITSSEHGTFLNVTDQAEADLVYKAQAYYANIHQTASRLGVGTTNPFFTLHMKSLNANGNLQYNEAPSLAAEEVNGDTSILSGCGTTAITCPPPFSGAGKWIVNHSGTGGSGMIQLNNTVLDTGESSIMYGNGVFAFGVAPFSASAIGQNAIWTQGTNNQFYGDGPVGANTANNAFFLYNHGLGPLDSTTPVTGNPNTSAINLVTVGDGQMSGAGQTGSSPAGACESTAVNCIPAQITDTHGVTLHNLAVGGSQFCTTFATTAEEATIDALFNPSARANIILIEGGGPDMSAGGKSAAQVFACQKEFAHGRRLKGWSIILYGMYSRIGTGNYGWTMDQWHDDLNGLYANGYTGFGDAYINVAADPHVGPDGSYANSTYFQAGGINIQASYTATLAALISPQVTAIANRASQVPISNIGAFTTTISALEGFQRNLYGITLGPGEAGALNADSWGNIDAFGVGLMNIGNGVTGDHNAYVRLGSVSAASGIFLDYQGVETATISAAAPAGGVSVISFGDHTIGDRNAILAAGYVDVQNVFSVNGVNGVTGPVCTAFVGGICTAGTSNVWVSSPGAGLIQFGQTAGAQDAVVTAGFFNANTLFSVGGINGFTGTCTVLPTVHGGIITAC